VIEPSLATFEEVDHKLWSDASWLFILVFNIKNSNLLRRPFTMSYNVPIETQFIAIIEREIRA
jgi:hypothetical protein